MGKALDLSGYSVGNLTVLKRLELGRDGVMWRCQCKCGNTVDVAAAHLKRGTKKSCGCLHRLPAGEANFNRLYYMYKARADDKLIAFELTESKFQSLTKSQCHYCGAEPNANFSPVHSNGAYIYNGIDRKDNDLGYTLDNVVPCCSRCNVAKKAMPYEEFLGFIKSVYIHLNLHA